MLIPTISKEFLNQDRYCLGVLSDTISFDPGSHGAAIVWEGTAKPSLDVTQHIQHSFFRFTTRPDDVDRPSVIATLGYRSHLAYSFHNEDSLYKDLTHIPGVCYYTPDVYKRQAPLNVMLSTPFKRKLLSIGGERRSLYINLPKPLVDYLTERGFSLDDLAVIELNDREELVLRLSRAEN